MKTTNYEISKQLKEAGFEAKTEFYWIELNGDLILIHETQLFSVPFSLKKIPAYDLETLLDALPNTTEIIISSLTGERIFYLDSNIRGNEVSIAIEENESLADTAGKMWLELKKKNLL